jgi:8-hydroxy-5-deazaflavin:NADPH oxidoreductase
MRIGIIGAGMIGSTLARLWVGARHDVCLASRHPEALEPVVEALGPAASAGTPLDAATFGDVVLLSVPLKAMSDLARELTSPLKGKVVLDTANAYERRDGPLAAQASAHPKGSAGWAAAMFPGSRWIKAFNTVYYKTLDTEAHRRGDQLGIPLAGDDHAALEVAAALVRDAGFDPVIVGPLVRGKEFEPDTTPYNSNMTGQQLRTLFGKTADEFIENARSR